jgi:putative nucleotidyltransferase with HDIG domain
MTSDAARNRNVNRLILATVAAAIITVAAASLFFPIRQQIGGAPGLVYWTIATLAASALPVRLPRGVALSVASAPIMAAMLLGGPTAAAIVTLVGTTDERELRGLRALVSPSTGNSGGVPWYGTVFNHAAGATAVALSGMLYDTFMGPALAIGPIAEFGLAIAACALFSALSSILAVIAVSVRTGIPFGTVLAQDISAVALNLGGLVPLAWLMAQVFQLPNGVGWWATPLFVVPLYTTRVAYARYVETRELFEQTISALSKAIDARDPYTRNHSSRVSHIAEEMCRVMRLPEEEIERIKWSGLLHDVGKIGIRDHILLKEGPLDKSERILMNQHPTIGAEIVAPASQLSDEAPLIKAHHEWFNGSGYPDGVEAMDIPLGARILTIADAYEAMTSSRPYRKIPLSHETAIEQLEKFSGIQFDPQIVPILIGLDREILDRPPDRDDELPSMLHRPEQRDVPAEPVTPLLAADDVP